MCAAIFYVGWYFWRKKNTYQPAHAITNAAVLLNRQAQGRIELNKSYLENIKLTQHYNLPLLKDSTEARELFRKAEILHNSACWLSDNIEDDSATIMYSNWGIWMVVKEQADLRVFDTRFMESKLIPSEQQAAGFRNRLALFLALVAPYPKSPATQRHYLKLRKLAALPPEDFNKAVYGGGKRYLQIAEAAIIRSAIAGIETECMEYLYARSKLLKNNLFQKNWVPFVPNAPVVASPGDSVRLTARLVYLLLLHKDLQPQFSFPSCKIDSMKGRSLVYASFLAGKLPKDNQPGPEKPQRKSFSVTLKLNGRDTTFSEEIRYFIRKPQSN